MAKGEPCTCCPCDPTVARMFEQSAARYNDQSGFASNESQKNFIHMSANFLATAQNTLEKHGTADMILQLRSVANQPAAA